MKRELEDEEIVVNEKAEDNNKNKKLKIEENKESIQFSTLPKNILQSIFEKMNLVDLGRLSCCNKNLNNLIVEIFKKLTSDNFKDIGEKKM